MPRRLVLLVLAVCTLWSRSAIAQPCTGLCLQQVTCPSSGTTSISGTVFAPNGIDPLPNVLVYVPNAPVQPFAPGVACEVAGQPASGSPLVETTTDYRGQFTLTNMPVGAHIPLVIQAGRWRRQVIVNNVPACVSTAVPATLTRLPRNKTEGDIPKIALVTGSVDAIECVLRKIGIQDSEFTNPSGTGRINVYLGAGGAGAAINGTTPLETQLWSSQAIMNQYDMMMLACQGNPYPQTPANQQRLTSYANAGGRVFATHYEYEWLLDPPFSGTALWAPDQFPPSNDPQTAFVNQSFPKGQQLAQWLQYIGASTTPGQITLETLRKDQNGVVAPTQSWLSINDPVTGPESMQFTFNTPVGAAASQQCGRVLFNEYHVENVANSSVYAFPQECVAGPMTDQEKLLEFALFDLSTFVAPDLPATVTVGVTNSPPTFAQGDAGDTVTINVRNSSATIATDHTLTLTVAIPNGLTAVSMAGTNSSSGWTCSVSTARCTRTSGLAAGASDPIALVVGVASDAPVGSGPVILTATAAGGGLASNVLGTDAITITGTAVITWPDPASIAYSIALGGAQLNATANVPGTFVYSPPLDTVLATGSHTLGVTFTPADTVNYSPVTATVTLVVSQATPTIAWPTPASIVYGTALSTTQLNATASTPGVYAYTPGTFDYSPPIGAVLATGSQTLSVSFTPSDPVNYTTATGTVTLVVTQATPVITWAAPASIIYGTILGGTQLNATASTAGAFVYSPAAGAVPNAGSQTLTVSFTPADTANFTTASAAVPLAVVQATPVITWSNPAAIGYGTALSGTQLNATTPVPGTFVYTPPAGTVLAAGNNQTLSAIFTPTDTVDFTAASASVSINVTAPVVTPSNCAADRDDDRRHRNNSDNDDDDREHDGRHDKDDCPPGTPMTANDFYVMNHDTTLTVPAKGVLANDGSVAATAALMTGPSHGALTFNPNGGFVYVPAAGFSGKDAFTYVARSAGGLTGPIATVTLRVRPNLAPDADDDYYTTKKSTALTVTASHGVLVGDSDANGDALTSLLVSGPSHGTVTLGADGSFVYKPANGYTGTDAFTYRAKDPGGLTDSATVTIKVVSRPQDDDAHDGRHESKHGRDGDHDTHRNGHFDGDGCERDRQTRG